MFFLLTFVHIGRKPLGESRNVDIVTSMNRSSLDGSAIGQLVTGRQDYEASAATRQAAPLAATRQARSSSSRPGIIYVAGASPLVRQLRDGTQAETCPSRLMRIQAQTIAQCRALQQRCKSELVFGLDTALRLQCIEVPNELNGDGRLVVVAPRRDRRRNIGGVRCVSWVHPMRCVKIGGLTCVAPDTTWVMYARETNLQMLVLLGDAMMRRDGERRWLGKDDLLAECQRLCSRARADDHRLPRKIKNCRLALMLMAENTDSFRESELRLLLMAHGLPMPYVNLRVDVPDGVDVGRRGGASGGSSGGPAKRCFFLDLSYPWLKVCVEYDGRQHAQNWESDVRRRTLLENDGWVYINATWEDLADDSSRLAFAQSVASRMSRQWNQRVVVHEPWALERLAREMERQQKHQVRDAEPMK